MLQNSQNSANRVFFVVERYRTTRHPPYTRPHPPPLLPRTPLGQAAATLSPPRRVGGGSRPKTTSTRRRLVMSTSTPPILLAAVVSRAVSVYTVATRYLHVNLYLGPVCCMQGMSVWICRTTTWVTVCDGVGQTPSDEFVCPFLDDRYSPKHRTTRLWKDMDDILPKPPPLIFVPRWFRRKPGQHFIPEGVLYTNTNTNTNTSTTVIYGYTVAAHTRPYGIDTSSRAKGPASYQLLQDVSSR